MEGGRVHVVAKAAGQGGNRRKFAMTEHGDGKVTST
jgi:hypothetical protein